MDNQLIIFLAKHNGKPDKLTWNEVGKLFSMTGEAARSKWKRFKLKHVSNNNGKVSTKYSLNQTPDNQIPPNFTITKITSNPNGQPWIRAVPEHNPNLIKDNIKKLINELNIKPLNLKPKHNNNNHNIILCVGDVHIGMKNQNDEWNHNKIIQTAHTITQKTIDLKPKNITIIFGGDLTDGADNQTTRKNHNLPQNLSNNQQLQTAFQFTNIIISNLSQYANTKTIFIANSNHGGIIEYATAFTIQKLFPNTTIQTQFIQNYNIYNKKYLITHGYDQNLRKKPLPRFLAPNDIILLSQYAKSQKFNIIRFDLHQYHNIQYHNITDTLCPAVAPNSDYIKANYSPLSSQQCVAFINHQPITINLK